jgi:DHA3 family macrolide efflux protein-like MFS transporter
MMATQFSVKDNRKWKVPFFTLWTGQAFSLLGSRVVQFALVWWLTKETGSATVLAMATLIALAPGILLGPISGALVDRWNRRSVMLVADAVIAVASLWLAYMFFIGEMQVWMVYAIMLLRAVGGTFHYPAMTASTSLMVPKERLTRLAGMNQTLNGALGIIAPPLGALFMDIMPLHSVMMIDVATALLAILPLVFINIPQPERIEKLQEGEGQPSIMQDIASGLRYIVKWKGLLYLIIGALIFKFALTPAFSLIPLLVAKHFQGGAAQLSFWEAIASSGIILGGVLLSIWGGFKRQAYTMISGLTIGGICVVSFGLTPSQYFWIFVVAGGIFGTTVSMVDGPIMAILQGTIDPEMQGRVFSTMGALLNLTGPIGLGLAGPVSDYLGIQVWFVIAGVLIAGVAIAFLFIPAVMNLENYEHKKVLEQDKTINPAGPEQVLAD